jgi:hypothetical protein
VAIFAARFYRRGGLNAINHRSTGFVKVYHALRGVATQFTSGEIRGELSRLEKTNPFSNGGWCFDVPECTARDVIITDAELGATPEETRESFPHLLMSTIRGMAAEDAGFDVPVTADKTLQFEQNLAGRKLALVCLSANSWKVIQPRPGPIVLAVDAALINKGR